MLLCYSQTSRLKTFTKETYERVPDVDIDQFLLEKELRLINERPMWMLLCCSQMPRLKTSMRQMYECVPDIDIDQLMFEATNERAKHS